MIELPAIRWGEPYQSLEVDEVNHFYTGEPVAKVHTVGAGHHPARRQEGPQGA